MVEALTNETPNLITWSQNVFGSSEPEVCRRHLRAYVRRESVTCGRVTAIAAEDVAEGNVLVSMLLSRVSIESLCFVGRAER